MRVLVVDDEADQLQTLCRGLLYLRITCLRARTAEEALAQLAGPAGERVDLVLVDMSAPGKPGAALVERLLMSRPRIAVLIVTGLALSSQVIALVDRGFPVVKKPFTPDQLGLAIATALNPSKEK